MLKQPQGEEAGIGGGGRDVRTGVTETLTDCDIGNLLEKVFCLRSHVAIRGHDKGNDVQVSVSAWLVPTDHFHGEITLFGLVDEP